MSRAYRKWGLFAFISFVMLVGLSGCGLANPALQDLKNGDKLIGIFVAFEEDLKDYEMQNGDTLYYQEKKLVRADKSVEKLTDKEIQGFNNGFIVEGKRQENDCYTFDNIDGYYMGYTERNFEEDGENYSGMDSHFSDGIYDTHIDSEAKGSEGDDRIEEEIHSLQGTIGISSKKEGELAINNVYERADGSIYTKIPSSNVLIVNPDSGGGVQTMSVSESYAANLTGTGLSSKEKKKTSRFSISIEQVNELKSAVIREMDKDHGLIKIVNVDLTKKDQRLQLDGKTEYVIVEEHFLDRSGKPYSKRTAYDCAQIGEADASGNETVGAHTFYRTKRNGRIALVDVNFVR